MSLMKKDNETVRHFALRVQQLVKKGWCNENAATINLKNNEIFTKGLPKKLKDFAHKRQVKHVSTLLEPSLPFHTLVRHVDSEDIANEKIRTNDLALEINKVSLEDDTNKKEFEHEDQIMITQTGDPNNKSKPAYRKYCSYCHKNNHSISNCYQKQRDDEYQKYNNQRSRTLQQSSIFKIRKDFPPLPYSTENQQFIKKFNFEYSDLTDTEYVNLCNILINNQNCYAKHKNDVGKISTPFRIRIKDNCKLHTQRPSKVPIHYRDRLNKLLLELEKYNIIKQIGSTTDEKHTIGTTFLNPLIIIPKGDAIKVVLDARHLNSNTNQELESWPIEPLAPQLARANKKYKSTIDLMYAFAHTPLDEETIKLTGFSSGDKLYAFIRGFYGLKGLPNFFTKQMSTFFRSLIDKRSALVYIDDILLLANEKQMFELIKELHTIASRENLKLAPEKSFYMLLKVKFLGHEIGNNTIKPIPSKIEAIKRIPSPKEKMLCNFLAVLTFIQKSLKNFI